MDSEIENDLSRLGTYFKNNFVQRIDEILLKYKAKLSFKGQLQRFHKLSLFDRFRYVENGLDINF